ncbi:COG2426 family protein [Caldisalinibacter kiritimatiensis]|uniref:Small multidrug export protein (QacE) n=1 Tax=Caldisalinibacter kiritimatiensis TaxID=1304284 RepID=R1CF77_9FIRM|nr:small multi-drug export protein [Caldisalinibacter kiritimatiensis]EOD00945.1 small multidrug export protein (qacE) [Caldisalinibacter kiritimatiensis]
MGDIISVFKKEMLVILFAMTPVFELRGAIPLGITLGFEPIHSTILSIAGNIIPVPLLLKLLKPTFRYFEKTKVFGGIIDWIKRRTLRRSEKVRKYKVFGLYLLVAIPLPTTGAWTGCIAASLFEIDFKQAFPAIVAGVITAGIIMLILSYMGMQIV